LTATGWSFPSSFLNWHCGGRGLTFDLSGTHWLLDFLSVILDGGLFLGEDPHHLASFFQLRLGFDLGSALRLFLFDGITFTLGIDFELLDLERIVHVFHARVALARERTCL